MTNTIGTEDYSSTWLTYARNGPVVTYILGETWTWDGTPGNAPTNYTVTYGREFGYGERSERERAAIGKASRRPATCPEEASRNERSEGAPASGI